MVSKYIKSLTAKFTLTFLVALQILLPDGATAQEGITIFGLNWGQNPTQMDDALLARGFEKLNDTVMIFSGGWIHLLRENPTALDQGYRAFSNADATQIVGISTNEITFSCSVFKVCDLGLREFGMAIVNEFPVQELAYDMKTYGTANSLLKIKKYCGFAVSGERICVKNYSTLVAPFPIPGDGLFLTFGRGRFGAKNPIFK